MRELPRSADYDIMSAYETTTEALAMRRVFEATAGNGRGAKPMQHEISQKEAKALGYMFDNADLIRASALESHCKRPRYDITEAKDRFRLERQISAIAAQTPEELAVAFIPTRSSAKRKAFFRFLIAFDLLKDVIPEERRRTFAIADSSRSKPARAALLERLGVHVVYDASGCCDGFSDVPSSAFSFPRKNDTDAQERSLHWQFAYNGDVPSEIARMLYQDYTTSLRRKAFWTFYDAFIDDAPIGLPAPVPLQPLVRYLFMDVLQEATEVRSIWRLSPSAVRKIVRGYKDADQHVINALYDAATCGNKDLALEAFYQLSVLCDRNDHIYNSERFAVMDADLRGASFPDGFANPCALAYEALREMKDGMWRAASIWRYVTDTDEQEFSSAMHETNTVVEPRRCVERAIAVGRRLGADTLYSSGIGLEDLLA